MAAGQPQEATQDRRHDGGEHRHGGRKPMDHRPTGEVPRLRGHAFLERPRPLGLLLRIGNGLLGQGGTRALVEIALLRKRVRAREIRERLRQPAERRVRV